jgi:GMP synthase-like glutamine amidotransferase
MKALDIGLNFGMPVAHIFKPWKAESMYAKTIAEAAKLMPSMDLVCFGGGADIHPSIYKHKNVASGAGHAPSSRDLFEIEIWKLCVENKKPILGICRGAQLACALSGGSLIQDVTGHGGMGGHNLITEDQRDVYMSSVHHQMMYLEGTKHHLIAWTKGRSERAEADRTKIRTTLPMDVEPEIVFFPETNCLAVQGHPEFYSDPMVPPVAYTRELVQKYLGVNP